MPYLAKLSLSPIVYIDFDSKQFLEKTRKPVRFFVMSVVPFISIVSSSQPIKMLLFFSSNHIVALMLCCFHPKTSFPRIVLWELQYHKIFYFIIFLFSKSHPCYEILWDFIKKYISSKNLKTKHLFQKSISGTRRHTSGT